MATHAPAFKRILLKLSGEALMGEGDYGIDPAVIKRFAGEIRDVRDAGVQVGLVIGGGNIFRGAGTANPFFTTDTAASLRAIEIGAELLIKATKVDGVYSADPKKDPKAKRYTHLTYDRIIADKLMVMDATAMVLCRDNGIPLRVFDLSRAGDLMRIVMGDTSVGTLVDNGEKQ